MTQPDPAEEIVIPTISTYLVDVESVSTKTYRVYATSEEDAKERFSDGLVVTSEATSPSVVKVSLDV